MSIRKSKKARERFAASSLLWKSDQIGGGGGLIRKRFVPTPPPTLPKGGLGKCVRKKEG